MTALTISVIPTVSASLARNDRVHTSRVINSSLRVTGLMAFPMGLGLWALAEPIMKLCYPRYDSELGGSLLAVLGIASMFVCSFQTLSCSPTAACMCPFSRCSSVAW